MNQCGEGREGEYAAHGGGGGGGCFAARPPRPTVQLSAPLQAAVQLYWQPPYMVIYV